MPCIPYKVFFRIHNLSGCLNRQPIGGLIMAVSFPGRLVLQKALFQLPFWRRCLCLIDRIVIWWRDEDDITKGNVLFFYQYLSSWLTRTTFLLLDLCGFMLDSWFAIMQHIKGMALGLPCLWVVYIIGLRLIPTFPIKRGSCITHCSYASMFNDRLMRWYRRPWGIRGNLL